MPPGQMVSHELIDVDSGDHARLSELFSAPDRTLVLYRLKGLSQPDPARPPGCLPSSPDDSSIQPVDGWPAGKLITTALVWRCPYGAGTCPGLRGRRRGCCSPPSGTAGPAAGACGAGQPGHLRSDTTGMFADGAAFLPGGSSPDAILGGLQAKGQACGAYLAAQADPFGCVDLLQRGAVVGDREEELRILTLAGPP